ncbi:hypothetical protein ACFOD0_16935 [Shewanella intestini]|uniref:Uncharacterized protein n=1 Tax=Shewanella intestini TaxID=2017544 RepID=A0ABS5I571_9GAMM|nr:MULTISPECIES: hypothetical protein [Shewanella]MBR9729178.1 hypothetical protein [Shewanella intestini]MRG37251.1 hypothetical protein [Shewanella sp. XMDDZSB0408]
MENIHLGQHLKQANLTHEALQVGEIDIKIDAAEQSEEVYRTRRKPAEHESFFVMAGQFTRKELIMRRMQMPRGSDKE